MLGHHQFLISIMALGVIRHYPARFFSAQYGIQDTRAGAPPPSGPIYFIKGGWIDRPSDCVVSLPSAMLSETILMHMCM